MTAPWSGLPPNPARDGYHWIGPRTAPFPAEWQAATRTWVWAYGRWLIPAGYVPPQVAQVVAENPNAWAYHGRCPAPRNKRPAGAKAQTGEATV